RRDAHQADARSDVFSFGKTLYAAATGLAPHTVRESRIPLPLRSIILRCLEEDPRDRYQSMKELAADLAAQKRGGQSRPERYDLVALDKNGQPIARFPLAPGRNLIGVAAAGVLPEVDLAEVDKHQIVSRE